MATPVKSANTRVWIIEGQAGPGNAPDYKPAMKAGTPSQPFGDVTRIQAPDPNSYGKFITVGEVEAGEERATMPIMGRYSLKELSDLLRLAKAGCRFDVQVHIGECRNPAVFNSGWTKVMILNSAKATTFTTDRDLGALESGDNAVVNEQSDLSADVMDEIVRMKLTETAAAEVAGPIYGIAVCDSLTCGDCGTPSDGCNKVFGTSSSSVASPTSGNDVIFSTDGGDTWTARTMPLFGAASTLDDIACVGDYLLVISVNDVQLAYIDRDGFIAGTSTWTALAVPDSKAPQALFSLRPDITWVACDDGYIYLMKDPTVTMVVSLAGTLTTEDLTAIHAYDEWNVLAVAENNGVVYTSNGGETWNQVTGPSVGVTLQTCWMQSPSVWFVGTAGGKLYYTDDTGASWTEKTFPGSGSGVVYKIVFDKAVPNVGYMSHSTPTPAGRILRTIDGGYSWYVLPETGVPGSIPANDRIIDIATCGPNKIFAGGVGDNAVDGIVVKGAAA